MYILKYLFKLFRKYPIFSCNTGIWLEAVYSVVSFRTNNQDILNVCPIFFLYNIFLQ